MKHKFYCTHTNQSGEKESGGKKGLTCCRALRRKEGGEGVTSWSGVRCSLFGSTHSFPGRDEQRAAGASPWWVCFD